MNHGLLMSDAEKLMRHSKLHRVVTTNTSHTWALVLTKMLLGQMGGLNTARRTPFIEKEALHSAYVTAKKRLFLLDYDVSILVFIYDVGRFASSR